uniref:Peptidase S1 domain-containing protein n=1 Tax=Romanomermis culicivorax TaxID=13658 RepID=A0A915K7F6_ROMCU
MIELFVSLLLAAYNPIINSAQIRLKRVENGRPVSPNSEPWMAILNLDLSPVCGAFLVSRNPNLHKGLTNEFSDILLTAGHCVVDKPGRTYFSHSRLSVSFGKHLWYVPEANQVNVAVIQVVVHPKFQKSPLMYDIAVLKLMKPVRMSKYIKPILLSTNTVQPLQECLVSGWGHHWNGNVPQVILRSAKVYNLTDNAMTLQGNVPSNIRISTGDSGSPLICTSENQTLAMGVVSNSDSDYILDHFTSIPHVLPWIMESIDTIDHLRVFNHLLEVYSTRQISSYGMNEIEYLSPGVFGHLSTMFDKQLSFSYMDQINFKQIWFMESLNDKVKILQDTFYMYDTIGFAFVKGVYECVVVCYLENRNGIMGKA